MLSNIAAGSERQLKTLIEGKAIEACVECLCDKTEDLKVKFEAYYALANLSASTFKDPIIISCLIEHKTLQSLFDKDLMNDKKFLKIFIETIGNLSCIYKNLNVNK